MDLQNENMKLVLSTDAKPRLKWTPELHQRFVEAVNQLGGAHKATPKSVMRMMAISGLTLYHLKSHLQKFRLGKNQLIQSESQSQSQEDYKEIQSTNDESEAGSPERIQNPINESFQIAQALEIQMEVQRKLHEQIEVQRHLQLRIEAQGKYLKSVLKKAQETLSGYNPCSAMGIELAKAELSRLVSMVNTGCSTSSVSELTEIENSILKDTTSTDRNQTVTRKGAVCSVESSLTSSDSSGTKDDNRQLKDRANDSIIPTVELPLMDIHPIHHPKKRCPTATICDSICVEQPVVKRSRNSRIFDLNSQYQIEFEAGSTKTLDLNCKES